MKPDICPNSRTCEATPRNAASPWSKSFVAPPLGACTGPGNGNLFCFVCFGKKKEKRAKVVALGAKGVAPTTAVFHGELRNCEEQQSTPQFRNMEVEIVSNYTG